MKLHVLYLPQIVLGSQVLLGGTFLGGSRGWGE